MGVHGASAIARVSADRVMVRDIDLSSDLIGQITLTDYFLLLVTGQRPTRTQVAVVDACIVAIAEHGLVPSVQSARMTLAASPESFAGAVASGLLGSGSVIFGSAATAAVLLQEVVDESSSSGIDIPTVAATVVSRWREAGKQIPGVGHPIHRPIDPRADALFRVGDQLGVNGPFVSAMQGVHAALPAVFGRSLPLNVSGAIAALLLDAGFPADAIAGVPLVGRTMSLVAHLCEERNSPIGFTLAEAAERAIMGSASE